MIKENCEKKQQSLSNLPLKKTSHAFIFAMVIPVLTKNKKLETALSVIYVNKGIAFELYQISLSSYLKTYIFVEHSLKRSILSLK